MGVVRALQAGPAEASYIPPSARPSGELTKRALDTAHANV